MSHALSLSAAAPRLDIGRPVRAGVVAVGVLAAVVGGWAGTTAISGAVVASGAATVLGHAKVIQHPDGGTVASIEVENGDAVAAGDVLFTLDPTLVSLNLDIARTRLAAALALKARLEAERAGADEIDFGQPDLPAAVGTRPLELAAEAAGQREIFAARAEVLEGNRARLVEALAQYDEQIAGTEAQRRAAAAQAELLQEQIATQEQLVAQGLARTSQLSDLRGTLADVEGRTAAHGAEIQRLLTAKRDAEIETLQSERGFREEVVTELRQVTGEIEELVLEIVTRQGELDRMVVRAPDAGLVHELALTTVGGVVEPGAVLMQVVPQDRGLAFEVQVDPASIDQVRPGQEAELVLAAFDHNTTPRLEAQVRTVSAAAISDAQSGRSFYRVELAVSDEELARLGAREIVPGMPVEAYLATGDRTVLSYLMQPIRTHLQRAFRE